MVPQYLSFPSCPFRIDSICSSRFLRSASSLLFRVVWAEIIFFCVWISLRLTCNSSYSVSASGREFGLNIKRSITTENHYFTYRLVFDFGLSVISCDILTEFIALSAGDALRNAFTGPLVRRDRVDDGRGEAIEVRKYGEDGRDISKWWSNLYFIYYTEIYKKYKRNVCQIEYKRLGFRRRFFISIL